jgi:hypothetical protein
MNIEYATCNDATSICRCNTRRRSTVDVAPSRCCTVALQPPPGRRPSGSTRDSRGRSALRRAAADRMGQAHSLTVARCGWGAPSPGADVGRGEPGPGAGTAGEGPVPVQMWAGVSPVPVQMWAGVSPVLVQMWACAWQRRRLRGR